MAHWKTLMNKKYLGSWDLEKGQNLTLTISEIITEVVKASAGAEEEQVPVIVFREDVKNMIMNNENGATLEKILQTEHYENWKGHRVTVYVKSGIKTRKGLVDGLRISNQLPAALADERKSLTPEATKIWANAISALKDGAAIERITDRYFLSEENKTKLLKDVEDEKGV